MNQYGTKKCILKVVLLFILPILPFLIALFYISEFDFKNLLKAYGFFLLILGPPCWIGAIKYFGLAVNGLLCIESDGLYIRDWLGRTVKVRWEWIVELRILQHKRPPWQDNWLLIYIDDVNVKKKLGIAGDVLSKPEEVRDTIVKNAHLEENTRWPLGWLVFSKFND